MNIDIPSAANKEVLPEGQDPLAGMGGAAFVRSAMELAGSRPVGELSPKQVQDAITAVRGNNGKSSGHFFDSQGVSLVYPTHDNKTTKS